MKLEIKELYRCGECREIHDEEDGARECCMPAVYTLYVCPVCAENHDEAEEAMSCCNADGISCPQCRRDYPPISIDYQSIKIAGHCSACNPLFTVDQQMAIQDLHHLSTGKNQNLFA